MFGKTAIVIIGLALLLNMSCSNEKELAQKNQAIDSLQQDIVKLKAEIGGKQKSSDQLFKDLNKQLADFKQKEDVWIQEKENMTTIAMANAVLFASGSNELTPEGKAIIDQLWEVLSKYPDRQIVIQGHTDNVAIGKKLQGRFASNWELSSARAIAVLDYVLLRADVKPGRLAVAGYGEFHPITDNSTPESRAKNRRVLITVSGQGI